MLEKIKQLPTEYDRLPRHEKIRLWINTVTNAIGVILLAIFVIQFTPILLKFSATSLEPTVPTDRPPDPTLYR